MDHKRDIVLDEEQFQLLNYEDCLGILHYKIPNCYYYPDMISDYLNSSFYENYRKLIVTENGLLIGQRDGEYEIILSATRELYDKALLLTGFTKSETSPLYK